MSEPVKYPVALVNRELSILWVAMPILALGVFLLLLGVQGNGWALVGGFFTCWLGTIVSMNGPIATVTSAPAQLTVSAGAVVLDGAPFASRRSLRAAQLYVTRDGMMVRLERSGPFGPIEILVESEADGRTLLSELGFDGSPKTFQVASPAGFGSTMNTLGAALLGAFLIFGGQRLVGLAGYQVEPALIWSLPAALLVWSAIALAPTTLVVGADGVLVRWLWRRRFIGYADVEKVGPEDVDGAGATVVVRLRSGAEVKLAARSGATKGSGEDERARVVMRLDEALALFRQHPPAGEARLPDRGQRPVAEWIRALRTTGSVGAADHRTAPVTADELWRIAEDPSAEQVSRAGAAVALGAGLDAAGKARLRIAAVATAAPELRDVLAATAESDDEEQLARALTRLIGE